MTRKFALPLLLLAATLAFAAGSAGATPSPATEQGAFFDTLDVNVASLEVVALDSAGHHVTDLGRDDFQLYEDGQPVPVDYLYRVGAGGANAAGQMPAGRSVEAAKASSEPLHVVIYVDDFNLRPEDRRRALDQLKRHLEDPWLESADFMVVTYDPSLHVRQPPTLDRGKVELALDSIGKLSAGRVETDRERLDVLEALAGRAPVLRCSLDGSADVRLTVESFYNDLERSLGALSDLVGSLAGLPGRKALIYVSDGLPMRPGEDLFYAYSEHCADGSYPLTEIQSYDASRLYSDLAADANANRVSFYTFEASGAWMPSAVSAERNLPFLPDVDEIHATNLESSLQYLASATGGLAVINTNDLEPGFRAMAGDLTSYYSLGFAPATLADGRHHRFRVETTRPGIRLRYASGYHAKTIEERLADATRSALLFGNGGNQLRARLERGTWSRVKKDRFLVPVRLTIPASRLALKEHNGVYEGTLRVLIAARDAAGRTSAVRENLVPVRFDQRPQGDFTWDTSLLVRGGEETIAVGVQDEDAQSTAILASTFTIG